MGEEEGFIRMYVRDFAHLASRAEAGADVEEALIRRVGEAQSHAQLMDRRKQGDHLGAVAVRVREEAQRVIPRPILREDDDPEAARVRRISFLNRVADLLEVPASAKAPA